MNNSYKKVAEAALAELDVGGLIARGAVIGFGTGRTADAFLGSLFDSLTEDEKRALKAVATSLPTEWRLREAGVNVLQSVPERIALVVDGADEVTTEADRLEAIKGGGGAFEREKEVASAAERVVILVDQSKVVARLGEKWAVPIAVSPQRLAEVKERVLREFALSEEALSVRVLRRPAEHSGPWFHGPLFTERGNLIVDVRFCPESITPDLSERLSAIEGVAGHGLFQGLITDVFVAFDDERPVQRVRRSR